MASTPLLEAVRLDLDRAEARMRACIAAVPDGTFHYEDYLETFMGGRFEPLLLPLDAHHQRRPHDRRLHRRLAAGAVSRQLDGRGVRGGRLHHREVRVRSAGAPEPGLVPRRSR